MNVVGRCLIHEGKFWLGGLFEVLKVSKIPLVAKLEFLRLLFNQNFHIRVDDVMICKSIDIILNEILILTLQAEICVKRP